MAEESVGTFCLSISTCCISSSHRYKGKTSRLLQGALPLQSTIHVYLSGNGRIMTKSSTGLTTSYNAVSFFSAAALLCTFDLQVTWTSL